MRAGLPQKVTMSRIRGRGALGEVGRHSLQGGLKCKQAGASGTCREAGGPGQQWIPGGAS